MYTYKATLIRIVDGDTYDLNIDLGFYIHTRIRVRLAGIDTPETYRPRNAEEKQHAKECTDFLYDNFPIGTQVEVATEKTGKYGRWIADIMLEDQLLSEMLKVHGFAKRENYGE